MIKGFIFDLDDLIALPHNDLRRIMNLLHKGLNFSINTSGWWVARIIQMVIIILTLNNVIFSMKYVVRTMMLLLLKILEVVPYAIALYIRSLGADYLWAIVSFFLFLSLYQWGWRGNHVIRFPINHLSSAWLLSKNSLVTELGTPQRWVTPSARTVLVLSFVVWLMRTSSHALVLHLAKVKIYMYLLHWGRSKQMRTRNAGYPHYKLQPGTW
jgi:hypothetical protein